MLARSALIFIVLTSGAQAAAFDDLKGYLASCLRFEMAGAPAERGGPLSSKVRRALERCSDDVARLDRADGRRLRGDGGISPSTKEVIRSVVSGGAGGVRTVRY
ncbi:hypothetical protein SAMN02799625_04621 [Methylobacterium sp. UNC300MFChir4.1]|jgi:hypothetical protein|uniref:hypothetical protein n=1 Tax=Methylobacterium sp. UNC300MFChir4.1 TaxID=1502747 RepID=UPI0008D38E4C|nr:hypothetical protein [Methylobacterium sp. UNC300MFChir4.1]SEP08527.1 hypothetical protein SAMN02799625_04621 [Methylobacterium sp. UNC300MFChir4.1]